jgi:transcriptional regulator of acetoin/glycerol metabolism
VKRAAKIESAAREELRAALAAYQGSYVELAAFLGVSRQAARQLVERARVKEGT